ncbi:MAG: hypothetical protein GF353_25355 [Candidatus Lokiarchaeota archaeon]|nr:hypothetical protein [Candidatus Lokiarchaeota archaeon]
MSIPDTLKLIKKLPEIINIPDSSASNLDTLLVKFPEYFRTIDPTPFYVRTDFWLSVFTVLIAVTALVLPNIKAKRKEEKRLNELRDYFLYLIRSTIEPIEKEIKDHLEMSSFISNKEIRNFGLNKSTLVFIDHVNTLRMTDLYKIFVERIKAPIEEKANHFRNIIRSLDLLKIISQNKEQNFYQFINTIKPIELKWEDCTNEILRKCDLYQSNFETENLQFKDDPFLERLLKVRSEWYRSDTRDKVDYMMSKLISPIQNLCESDFKDQRSMKLMQLTTETERCYVKITGLRKQFAEGFKASADKLSQLKYQILEAYNFYISQ